MTAEPTIPELLALRAAEHARDTFCTFAGERTTFADLAGLSRGAGARLQALGVATGDRVALMLPSHPEHVALFLGAAIIGAVIVPVSRHLKRDGLVVQLADADPKLVVADPDYAAELLPALADLPSPPAVAWHGTPPRRSAVDHAVGDLGAAGTPDAAPPDPERTLGIAYTSGTTGAPKGVMQSDRWYRIGAKNAALLADVQAHDVLFLWEPFHHIAGWMTVLMSLQHAVPIAMVERFSASRCLDQVRESGATKLHYLGGVMNLLLKQPRRADDADNPATIAWGAAAPATHWREFEQRFGMTVREGYGISEASNFNTLNLAGRVGSIGTPVEEFEAWIAGPDGTPAPPRTTGEIVLRPRFPGVTMQGYFRNPAKTAEVLRDGCVYTGDLGWQDEDGFFYYAGRGKDSLRRRGENVSAWEVERVLNAHADVEESAVIGVPSDLGEDDIKAFVKPAPGAAPDPAALLDWCRAKLAYYQVPRYVVVVDEFPRGPTQRIRKGELSRATDEGFDAEAAAPPSTGGPRH